VLTWSYLVPVNAFMLLVPHPLLCDWGHDTIPLIKSLFDTRNIITLSFLVSLAVFTYAILQTTLRSRARSPAIFISVGWAAITFLPASNLFFPVGFVVADRVLYTPTMGSCMLLAHAACVLRDKRRLQQPRLMSVLSSLLLLLLLLLPVAYFARTWLRQFFSPSAPPHPPLPHSSAQKHRLAERRQPVDVSAQVHRAARGRAQHFLSLVRRVNPGNPKFWLGLAHAKGEESSTGVEEVNTTVSGPALAWLV